MRDVCSKVRGNDHVIYSMSYACSAWKYAAGKWKEELVTDSANSLMLKEMASMLLSQSLDILGNLILSWFMLTDFFKPKTFYYAMWDTFFSSVLAALICQFKKV